MKIYFLKTICSFAVCLIWAVVGFSDEQQLDLTKIDRTILREPEYQYQPHYVLFVYGPKVSDRSWFVIDGDNVAYLDRNGNGDLTEDGERIESTQFIQFNNGGKGLHQGMNVFPIGELGGVQLRFDFWVRNPEFDISQHEFYAQFGERGWVNGSLMRIAEDGIAAQTPTLLTSTAEEAQITRLTGELIATIRSPNHQKLEPWPKRTQFEINLGFENLLAKDCQLQNFALTRLATSEVPAEIKPIVTFESPPTRPGDKPITTTKILTLRCCGDCFYDRITLPRGITKGNVQVTVTFPNWLGEGVVISELQVPVNQELARFTESTYVMFHNPEIDLKQAAEALKKKGLEIRIAPKSVQVYENGKPVYFIIINRHEEVQEVAKEMGSKTEHAAALSVCDTRFEIGMRDFQKSPTETALLTEIQSALQELTQGYLYQTWNEELRTP